MKYLCLAYGDQQKMEALTKAQFDALVAKCAFVSASIFC